MPGRSPPRIGPRGTSSGLSDHVEPGEAVEIARVVGDQTQAVVDGRRRDPPIVDAERAYRPLSGSFENQPAIGAAHRERVGQHDDAGGEAVFEELEPIRGPGPA